MRIEVVQLKRGNRAALEAVLRGERKPADGEPIFEIDTGKLKFGDGQHNYVDLEYFRTGDVEIAGSLDGQILIYNESLDKWEPKNLADNQSIEYSTGGLQIAGFGPDKQGTGPIVNDGRIIWKQAITDETLDAKVNLANEAAFSAGQSAAKALQAVDDAQKYAGLKSNTGIYQSCKNKKRCSGKHPLTGQPLHWMYYDDYLKSTASTEVSA